MQTELKHELEKIKFNTERSYLGVEYKELPKYKNIDGILCASHQPGYYYEKYTEGPSKGNFVHKTKYTRDLLILEELKKYPDLTCYNLEQMINENILDKKLIENLDAIKENGIVKIYSLAQVLDDDADDRNPEMIKEIWEKCYGGKYILNIGDVNIGIKDYTTPTQEQLKVITEDVENSMKKGEKILIQCGYGAGRTTTVLAAIDIKLNAESIKNYCENNIKEDEIEKIIEKHQKYVCDNYYEKEICKADNYECLAQFLQEQILTDKFKEKNNILESDQIKGKFTQKESDRKESMKISEKSL